MSLFLFLACSPQTEAADTTNSSADGVADPVVGTPVLVLDAASQQGLHFGALCGLANPVVELFNEGDALLEVERVRIDGEGWEMAEQDWPLLVGPGDSAAIGLSGRDGRAQLLIQSNDPEAHEVIVELSAVADAPPSVQLDYERQIVPVGESLELVALVGDDIDDPRDLHIVWSTDLEGEICEVAADEGGVAIAPWDSGERAVGDHTVSVSVTDPCGNETVEELSLCQEGGFAMDGLGLDDWNLVGSSSWSDEEGWLEITPAEKYQVGSAFMTTATVPADQVRLDFEFYVGEGTGADGFAIVALDSERMNDFLGAEGCALGYAGPSAGCIDGSDALPGWAIEVDSYYNHQMDPTEEDHVSLHIDGDQEQIWGWAETGELEDTGWHAMSILVEGRRFRVEMDGVLLIDQEVEKVPEYQAWIGFTGATGGDTNVHRVRSLVVTDSTCL